jgi:hypothetical protein
MSPTSASFFVIFWGKKWLAPNKSDDESMTRLDEFQVSLKITKTNKPLHPLQETSLQHMMCICNN